MNDEYTDDTVPDEDIEAFVDCMKRHGTDIHRLRAEYKGNTAQSPPDGFARNLLADFPSYCTEISCRASARLRNIYTI
ncbi:MAG: hypothetical protein MR038_00110 [Oscillospiraceae bacterium]|nr:hypothetical protein [Oscillospiraceae bacterium]